MRKRKIGLGFVIFLVVFAVFLALCYKISSSYEVDDPPVRWSDDMATAVPYYVNVTDVPGGLDFEGAVDAASKIWNDVSPDYFSFYDQGLTTTQTGTQDGENTWYWSASGDGMDDDTLAVNRTVWDPTTEPQTMYEFDVKINGRNNFNWEVDTDLEDDVYDLQHVACHEAGHALKLNHSLDRSAMMYYSYHASRALAQDDIDGLVYLYQGWAPSSPSPSPSPSLIPDEGGDGDSGDVAGGSSGGGGCFIATAAYGSYMHKDVMVLRQFRDKVLLQTAPGIMFVQIYYAVSPSVANYIAGDPFLRGVTRLALSPVIYALKYPIFALLIFLVCLALFVVIIRKMGPGKETVKIRIDE